jgi:hypothetical protein
MPNDGDTLEEYYKRARLYETRRKFLDELKEGRENSPVTQNSPVKENLPVMKKQIDWGIELVKKHKIRRYSLLRI